MRVQVPWQQLIAAELALGSVVVVRDLVGRHLGREPTRAELNAARRAANRYAANGHAQIVRIPSRTSDGADRLLLGLTVPTTRHAQLTPSPRRGRPRSDLVVARGLSQTLYGASNAAQLIEPDRITVEDAAVLAADLDEPIRRLTRLRLALLQCAAEPDD